jgi:hypothetical protein
MFCRPLIGSYVAHAKGWPWTQWVTVFLAIVAFLFAIRGQETYENVLKTKCAGYSRGNDPDESSSATAKLKLLLTSTLFRPWKMFFTEPIVCSFAFYIGFNFGVYYAFFAALPYIFEDIYHFSLQNVGPTFLGLAVGNILGFIAMVLLSRIALKKRIAAMKAGKAGPMPPEKRLLPALIGSWFVPVSLFWIGWSARPNVHWIVMIVGSSLFAFGNFLVFVSMSPYILLNARGIFCKKKKKKKKADIPKKQKNKNRWDIRVICSKYIKLGLVLRQWPPLRCLEVFWEPCSHCSLSRVRIRVDL